MIISRLYIIISPFTIIIDPENHNVLVVSLIFQPLSGRVYVNLLEGIIINPFISVIIPYKNRIILLMMISRLYIYIYIIINHIQLNSNCPRIQVSEILKSTQIYHNKPYIYHGFSSHPPGSPPRDVRRSAGSWARMPAGNASHRMAR